MTEQEWCAQNPDQCDEEGVYLYNDRPWEDHCYDQSLENEYRYSMRQLDQDEFMHDYVGYIETTFDLLTFDEKEKWVREHESDLEFLKAMNKKRTEEQKQKAKEAREYLIAHGFDPDNDEPPF